MRNLPLGQVLDQISCWMIAERGAKEKFKKPSGGSLYDQMDSYC